jgi:hypothetical protein
MATPRKKISIPVNRTIIESSSEIFQLHGEELLELWEAFVEGRI